MPAVAVAVGTYTLRLPCSLTPLPTYLPPAFPRHTSNRRSIAGPLALFQRPSLRTSLWVAMHLSIARLRHFSGYVPRTAEFVMMRVWLVFGWYVRSMSAVYPPSFAYLVCPHSWLFSRRNPEHSSQSPFPLHPAFDTCLCNWRLSRFHDRCGGIPNGETRRRSLGRRSRTIRFCLT